LHWPEGSSALPERKERGSGSGDRGTRGFALHQPERGVIKKRRRELLENITLVKPHEDTIWGRFEKGSEKKAGVVMAGCPAVGGRGGRKTKGNGARKGKGEYNESKYGMKWKEKGYKKKREEEKQKRRLCLSTFTTYSLRSNQKEYGDKKKRSGE